MTNDPIKIKSYTNGIKLLCNDGASFDDIRLDVKRKFSESAKFFNKAHLTLSFEGKELSDDERLELSDIIEDVTTAKIICVVCEDDDTDAMFLSLRERAHRIVNADMAKLYTNSVHAGQVLKTESGIVVTGDVEEGAYVYAGGSIVVTGKLLGCAKAGLSDDAKNVIVSANAFYPSELAIDGIELRPDEVKHKLLKKKKPLPVMAATEDGGIVFSPLY